MQKQIAVFALLTLAFLIHSPMVICAAEKSGTLLDTVERQGDFVVLGFDDMSRKVRDLVTGRYVIENENDPGSEMMQVLITLDDEVALFQTMGGVWHLWDLKKNRFITALPAMPEVGGLKGFFRVSPTQAVFTYYRYHNPITIVDLTTGKRREIPSPGKRWYVEQIRGPLFLSLANEQMGLLDVISGRTEKFVKNCRRFAYNGNGVAVSINPSEGGEVTLTTVSVPDMKVIKRRNAALDITDFHTNFDMGFNEEGDIFYITGPDSVVFFKLPSLEQIGRIPGMNFKFAGTKGLIAYDRGRDKDAKGQDRLRFCVQDLEKDTTLFCLDYQPNVYEYFGHFNVARGFVWANNGKRLRTWDIRSGLLVSDFQVPECFRPEYAPRDDLPQRFENAKLWDEAVTGKDLAFVACAKGKRVDLYRLKKEGTERVLSKEVASSFGVFILREKKRLAHVDEEGKITSWPYGF